MTREMPIASQRLHAASSMDRMQSQRIPKRLLLVGPKPPPIGGSPLTVQALLAEFSHYPDLEITLINTSPGMDVRRTMTGFNWEKVRRALVVFPEFLRLIPRNDAALVFSNDLFSITLVPFLRFIARIFGKPFFLKPVAASLDLFISRLNPILRWYLISVLKSCDGILPQTRILEVKLTHLGCRNVKYLPGCRPGGVELVENHREGDNFRLICLGHITRRKGVLFLLEAVSRIEKEGKVKIICDFYGPVHDEICEEFFKILSDSNLLEDNETVDRAWDNQNIFDKE